MKVYLLSLVIAFAAAACCNAQDNDAMRQRILRAWEQRVTANRLIRYEITATTKIFSDSNNTVELSDRVDIELDLVKGTFRRERDREELVSDNAKKRLAGVATFDGLKVRSVLPSSKPEGKGEYAEVSGDIKQYQLDDFFPSILVNSGHFTLRPYHSLYYGDFYDYKPMRDIDLLSPEIVQIGSQLRLSSTKVRANDGGATLAQEIYCNPARYC